jgi:hypothetical protein
MCTKKLVRKLLVPVLLLAFNATAEAITFTWEHITGSRSSPPYGWNYSYDIGYYNDVLMVDVDIRLTGYSPSSTLRNRWENGIETIWSTDRFSVPISFNVDWVTTDYDQTVDVANTDGRWSLSHWYTIGASGWGDAYQEEEAAHEFGHMLSMWDEYAGGAVNPENLINTGGIMHTLNGPTLDYYYDPFLNWYQDKLPSLGDTNADGLVDDADALILASHLHQMGGANWFDGDFNGDSNVDDRDASILAAHWHEGVEASTTNVPEPAALVMLAGTAVSLWFVAHRERGGR